jgi:hypothetical protein
MGKIRFLNNRILPDHLHQIVFADDLASQLDQRNQRFDRLRRQKEFLGAAIQHPARRIETVFLKQVNYSVRIAWHIQIKFRMNRLQIQ